MSIFWYLCSFIKLDYYCYYEYYTEIVSSIFSSARTLLPLPQLAHLTQFTPSTHFATVFPVDPATLVNPHPSPPILLRTYTFFGLLLQG